jgi:hypothetical protein
MRGRRSPFAAVLLWLGFLVLQLREESPRAFLVRASGPVITAELIHAEYKMGQVLI